MTDASWQLRLVRFGARRVARPLMARASSPFWPRIRTETAARVFLRGRAPWAFRDDVMGGVPVRRRPGGGGTLFYIHGGAFMLFSARSHQGIAARLATALGLAPVLPDYRRAPEVPFPGALDDVTAAYAALDDPVVLAGDSAGGGLVLSLLQRILARGLPLPKAVLLFSPWTDLTLSGPSLAANAAGEALLPAERMAEVVEMYLNGADAADPAASPLFGDYTGAPPVLVQAIADEILLSDATRLADRLRTAGVEVQMQVLPHGLHAFQLGHGWLPEATAAVNAAIAFARAAGAGR